MKDFRENIIDDELLGGESSLSTKTLGMIRSARIFAIALFVVLVPQTIWYFSSLYYQISYYLDSTIRIPSVIANAVISPFISGLAAYFVFQFVRYSKNISKIESEDMNRILVSVRNLLLVLILGSVLILISYPLNYIYR